MRENNSINKTVKFDSKWYQDFNQKRLTHLASLNLDLNAKKVLEVGAGVGDLTSFWINRKCEITIIEPKLENRDRIKEKFKDIQVYPFDLNEINVEDKLYANYYDIVFCYGLLYHLKNPAKSLKYLAEITKEILILETAVAKENKFKIARGKLKEENTDEKLGIKGYWNRLSRQLLFTTLKFFFPYVYIPTTQPNHYHFPIDWINFSSDTNKTHRVIFIASKKPIYNDNLTNVLLNQQQYI